MINIVEGREVTFSDYCFNAEDIRSRFSAYAFTNQRPITRSMLVWWAFHNLKQALIDPDTVLEVEHIYARKRNEFEPLTKRSNLEALGNKAMLEKSVNIRAADYRFEDKKKYYLGYKDDRGQERAGTKSKSSLTLQTTEKISLKQTSNTAQMKLSILLLITLEKLSF